MHAPFQPRLMTSVSKFSDDLKDVAETIEGIYSSGVASGFTRENLV